MSRGVRRALTGTVASLVVVALVAVAALAWYFSGVALAVDHSVDHPLTASPVGTTAVRITPRDRYAARPGVYGLAWASGYTRVGAVIAQDSTSVTRELVGSVGAPPAGTAVTLDDFAYTGDPRSALGLAFTDVPIATPLGPAPAWYVPAADAGTAGTWAVFVHGHDSSRQESLRYLTTLHALGLPVLVPTYRNDVGAPASPDGFDHLGDTEWRDVEAAVRYALARGASDVVLFGWSMGGAVVLQLMDRSPVAARVRAVVLDSPVLDWRSVFATQGAARGLPGPLTSLAVATLAWRADIDFDRFDWISRARSLSRPILLFHGTDDTYVPDGPSRQVAAARPDLVTAVFVAGAEHTRSWNVDPQRYERTLSGWLSLVGVRTPLPAG